MRRAEGPVRVVHRSSQHKTARLHRGRGPELAERRPAMRPPTHHARGVLRILRSCAPRAAQMLALVSVAACTPAGLAPVAGDVFTSPDAVDFGDVYAGTSATFSLQVTNTGRMTQPLHFAVSAPFESPTELTLPGGDRKSVV